MLRRNCPTTQHVSAFKYLCNRFKTILSRIEWPDSAKFGYVERQWDPDRLLVPYKVLVLNLWDLAQLSRFKLSWYPTKRVLVQELRVCPLLFLAFGPKLKKNLAPVQLISLRRFIYFISPVCYFCVFFCLIPWSNH